MGRLVAGNERGQASFHFINTTSPPLTPTHTRPPFPFFLICAPAGAKAKPLFNFKGHFTLKHIKLMPKSFFQKAIYFC